ncbi:hypothetical protein DFQ28_008830 [Apophysomyces sp. BC1034]|nr:hypothetical protein DFQ28_008830 [Apophysomyces sp. BC1034]
MGYMPAGALFLVIGAHFWLLFSRIPVDPLAFGVLGNIEGVLVAMVLGAKEFFLGSSSTANKQAAVITSFATDPETQVTTQMLSPMPTNIQSAPPALADDKP